MMIPTPTQASNPPTAPPGTILSPSQRPIGVSKSSPPTLQSFTAPESVHAKLPIAMEHGDFQSPQSTGQVHLSPHRPNDAGHQELPYGRRRRYRTPQACNQCRDRKRKCDAVRPSCTSCKQYGQTCKYSVVPPSTREVSMAQLQRSVDYNSGVLLELTREWRRYVTDLPPSSRPFGNTPNIASPKMESPMFPYPNMSNSGSRDIFGLQNNHTASAHGLLEEWTLMKRFPNGVEYLKWLKENGSAYSGYLMQLEGNRAILRVRGFGEGSPESSNDSARERLWGHPPLDYPSPHPDNGTPRGHPHYEHLGGLGSDGKPNFLCADVDRYHKAYMEHMYAFHPLLNPGELQGMIRVFKEQYCPDGQVAHAASPAAHQLNPGVKRKRPSSTFGEPHTPHSASERSLHNCIVLLVLALGQVCSFKEPLPYPASNEVANPTGSFSSIGPEDHGPRNIEHLPGLVCYSYASDILEKHRGYTVGHAQANILAALFIGQYARVMESWNWIRNACQIAMVLIQQDYANLQSEFYTSGDAETFLSSKERYRLELVLLVYWTCVLLESDIVAEMSTLPMSQVTQHQDFIMYPAGVNEYLPIDGKEVGGSVPVKKKPEDDKVIIIYLNQIWMRVILNEAHNALYGAGASENFDQGDITAAQSHIDYLKRWRLALPAFLKWNDEDPPATDLNVARLRAKYYGGLYMMLRPCLQIAAHAIERPSFQRVIVACQCIESAIQSTIAFDRVGAPENSPYEGYKATRKTRLVLTNIFGTLHAQFGKMLVLAAVCKSNLYDRLPANTSLTPPNLHALFTRTLAVLEEVAPNSPSLKADYDILFNVRAQLISEDFLYDPKE